VTFNDILNGWQIFIDANILVYHATAHVTYGNACRQLIEPVARQEIDGFTSAHVLGDMAHRVMTLEAMTQFGWTAKAIAKRLRKNPTRLQHLTRFRQAVDEVPQIGIQVLPVAADLISKATAISQLFGLLIGDALIVAIMRQQGLTHLASADTDFDRVPGITRYGPE
jgi:predicted nucleic acid-binding protein